MILHAQVPLSNHTVFHQEQIGYFLCMLLFGYFLGKTDLRDRCHQQKDNYCNCGNKVDDEQFLKQTHSFFKSCEITFGTFWQMTSTIEKQMCLFQGKTKIMIRMFMKIIFFQCLSVNWNTFCGHHQYHDNYWTEIIKTRIILLIIIGVAFDQHPVEN